MKRLQASGHLRSVHSFVQFKEIYPVSTVYKGENYVEKKSATIPIYLILNGTQNRTCDLQVLLNEDKSHCTQAYSAEKVLS